METFKSRVEHYTGPVDHSLDSLLSQTARSLVDLIPPGRAEQYTIEQTDKGTGVPLEGVRFISAHKNGRRAVLKAAGMQTALQDADSIHAASAFTPAVVITAGKAFVYPAGGRIQVIPYPAVGEGDTRIPQFPEAFEVLVVLGAARQRVIEKMNDRSVDDDDVELAGPLGSLRDRLDNEYQRTLQTLFPQTDQQ